MPIVRVEVLGPVKTAYSASVLSGVRAGISAGLGVPDSRVIARLFETAQANAHLPANRTERFTVVDIALYEGRTDELKAACAAEIRANLARDPGIEPSDVAVLFRDMSRFDLNLLAPDADS